MCKAAYVAHRAMSLDAELDAVWVTESASPHSGCDLASIIRYQRQWETIGRERGQLFQNLELNGLKIFTPDADQIEDDITGRICVLKLPQLL